MKTQTRLVAVAAVALAACFGHSGAMLTQQEIDANGTHTFNAPAEKVMKAAADALKSDGYEIAVVNPEKGLIKTGRKGLGTQVSGGQYSASAVTYSRQMSLTIKPAGDGNGTTVTARPRVYANDNDLSEGAVWALEGPQGERAIWSRLFREIEEGL